VARDQLDRIWSAPLFAVLLAIALGVGIALGWALAKKLNWLLLWRWLRRSERWFNRTRADTRDQYQHGSLRGQLREDPEKWDDDDDSDVP
jgi:hypothetical protein